MNTIRIAVSLALFVIPMTASGQVLLFEDFNDNAAGWALDGTWQIGSAQVSIWNCQFGGNDPGSDADGKPFGGIAGNLIGACVPPASPSTSSLTSPQIDASGATQLRLEFDHWFNFGGQPADVEVFNGSAWIHVAYPYPSPASWAHVVYDISAHANASLRVRFRYSYGYIGNTGWSLDNVRISNKEFFFDRFRDNAAGWWMESQWAIGNATASSGCATDIGFHDDPASDADGTPAGGVAGIVLGGCVGPTVHPQIYLMSPPIDTSNANLLRLSFDRFLNSDYAGYMNSVVEVFDENNWVEIFGTPCCAFIADSSWVRVTYDVTAYKNPSFRIRFGYDNTGAAYDVSGWNVDNVSVFDPSGCRLAVWAYNGPGSIRVKSHCLSAAIPPGTILFNCFTGPSGAFPNGWFFGIEPSLNDIIVQVAAGAPPFIGPSNSEGDLTWEIPAWVPAGIALQAVSVALSPGLSVLGASPPVSFVTM